MCPVRCSKIHSELHHQPMSYPQWKNRHVEQDRNLDIINYVDVVKDVTIIF